MTESPPSFKDRILYKPGPPRDDRSRMRAVINNLILHLHPTKVPKPALRLTYTWGLGGISTILATLLVITGVLLMFRYDASVERAYTSIQYPGNAGAVRLTDSGHPSLVGQLAGGHRLSCT